MGNELGAGSLFNNPMIANAVEVMRMNENIHVERLEQMHERIRQRWHRMEPFTNRDLENPTVELKFARKAMKKISIFFRNSHIIPRILEVGSGNCVASAMLYKRIIKFGGKLTATDLYGYMHTPIPEVKCDCEEAIKRFGESSNILLLFSPTPTSMEKIVTIDYDVDKYINENGYYVPDCCGWFMDYFAIKAWIELCQQIHEKRYIVFFGELGGSDGTTGMYTFMLEHPYWKLIRRMHVSSEPDMFGGNCVKEVFIFEN